MTLKTPQIRHRASFEAYRSRITPQSNHQSKLDQWLIAEAWEDAFVKNAPPHLVGTLSLPTKNAHDVAHAGEVAKNYMRKFLNSIHHGPMFKEWRKRFYPKGQQHIVWHQAYVNGDGHQPHVHWVLHFEHQPPSPQLLEAAFDIYRQDQGRAAIRYKFWCENWDWEKKGLIRYAIACHPNEDLEEVLCTRRNRCKNVGRCVYLKTLEV